MDGTKLELATRAFEDPNRSVRRARLAVPFRRTAAQFVGAAARADVCREYVALCDFRDLAPDDGASLAPFGVVLNACRARVVGVLVAAGGRRGTCARAVSSDGWPPLCSGRNRRERKACARCGRQGSARSQRPSIPKRPYDGHATVMRRQGCARSPMRSSCRARRRSSAASSRSVMQRAYPRSRVTVICRILEAR